MTARITSLFRRLLTPRPRATVQYASYPQPFPPMDTSNLPNGLYQFAWSEDRGQWIRTRIGDALVVTDSKTVTLS